MRRTVLASVGSGIAQTTIVVRTAMPKIVAVSSGQMIAAPAHMASMRITSVYQRRTHDGSGKRTVVDAAPRSTITFVSAGASYVAARSACRVCAGDDAEVCTIGTGTLWPCAPSRDSRRRRHDAVCDVGC